MSTLMMATFADRVPAPVTDADADDVKTTVTTVDVMEPAAVQPTPPEYGALFVDTDADGGLHSTQLASYVRPSRQGAPVADMTAGRQARETVSESNSTSGHAATKEATGQWGHGTLQIVEGIEPPMTDGHEYRGDYFAADNRSNPAGAYMTATRVPDGTTQAIGETRAQDAVTASQTTAGLYAAFLAATTGSGS